MNNFDLGSKKFMIITLVILGIFVLLIVKAFDFMASHQPDNGQLQQATDYNRIMDNMQFQNNQEESRQDKNQQNQDEQQSLDVDLQNNIDIKEEEQAKTAPTEQIEEIIPEGTAETERNLSDEQETELKFLEIQKIKNDKQYVKALEEYKSIADGSSDVNVKARCYEEMANIYGVVKRYGTALAYAQKAYSIAPTSSRELLIARLYYKTGEIDKATTRINNVLKRDFANN